jgi:hypothetical protein
MICSTCLGDHARGQPHLGPVSAPVLLERLLADKTPTNRNVLIMLRAGVAPQGAGLDARKGMDAVGDEYAEFGRIRSQAIQRTVRRAFILKLSAESKRFTPTKLCHDLLREILKRDSSE